MVQQSPTGVGPEPVALGKGRRGPRMPDDVMMVWSPQIELSFSDNHFIDQHRTRRSFIVHFLWKTNLGLFVLEMFLVFLTELTLYMNYEYFEMSSQKTKKSCLELQSFRGNWHI